MTETIKLLDVVAVSRDRPADGLKRGQVGTVVDLPAPGVGLIEFSDDQGRAYAMATIPLAELIAFHYQPAMTA